MQSAIHRNRTTGTAALVLALALFFSFALFHHRAPGWNVNSRLCLAAAIANDGTVQIDKYEKTDELQTDDVAEFNGHVYSDKAIGTSLLAIPAVYAAHRFHLPLHYTATLLVSGLSAALLGALLMLWLSALSRAILARESVAAPAFISAITILGTQYFGHATLLLAYAPAAAGLVGALLLLQNGTNAGKITPVRSFLIGLLLGFVILCETLWSVAALGTAVLLAWNTRHNKPLVLWSACLGGIILGILPFFVYCISIFGNFSIPYQFERNEMFRQAMSQGLMGATLPNPTVLWYITLHPYRGLFFHSPFLLLGIAGFFLLLRNATLRPLAIFSAVLCVFYLLFNSGYYMWWGGWSFSPRHLAMLPILLAPLLYAAWSRWSIARLLTVLLAVPALVIHLVTVCLDPQWRDLNGFTTLPMLLHPESAPELQWLWPRHIWPLFASGQAPGTVFGQGMTLTLLALIWTIAVATVFLCERKARQLYIEFKTITNDKDN